MRSAGRAESLMVSSGVGTFIETEGEAEGTGHKRTQGRELLYSTLKWLVAWGVILSVYVAIFHFDKLGQLQQRFMSLFMGAAAFNTGVAFSLLAMTVFVWRVVLVCRYRSIEPCTDEELPRCTVVVPAYNEGRQVFVTMESLAQSDYPAKKLQLIAVDDGSVDDTWHWIREAEKKFRGRVRALRMLTNQGKRHALNKGFRNAWGDVVVTVDSDCTVEPQTLRYIVSHFVRNPRVGAVAGNVRVLNRDAGLIPKMMDVVFLYGFDFVRASQSVVNSVLCTPGALSAYRMPLVRKVLKEWLEEKFLGRPVKIGEDRGLTNLVLREGYHVLFERKAVVYTEVPVKFKNLCKMYLRWERSNVQQTIGMCRYAFTRFRPEGKLGARVNLIVSVLDYAQVLAFTGFTYYYLIFYPAACAFQLLLVTIGASTVSFLLYLYHRRDSDAIWAFAYGVFYVLALFWITPYSMLTPHKNGWLTRQVRQPKTALRERENLAAAALSGNPF